MDAELLRDTILGTDDAKREPVHVPEWNVTVYLRSLTATERDQFEKDTMRIDPRTGRPQPNLGNMRARLVALTAVDKAGARVFSHEGDVRKLGEKNVAPVQRLFDKAMEMAALTEGDLEKLEGNSDADLSDDSSTD